MAIGQIEVDGVSAGPSASEDNQFKRVTTSNVSAGHCTTPQRSSAFWSERRTHHVSLTAFCRTFAVPLSHRRKVPYLDVIFETRQLDLKEVVSRAYHDFQSERLRRVDSYTCDTGMGLVGSPEALHTTAARSERLTICRQHHGLAASGDARISTLAGAQRAVWTAEFCHCARPDHRHHT